MHTAQLMPLPLTYDCSLVSVKSRLVLPFWYRLTWVVPDTGPLNVCVCVCVCVCVIEKLIPSRYSARVWITDGYRAVRIGFQHYIMSQYLKQSDYQIATVPFPLLIFLFKCNISSFVFVFLFS